MADRKIAVVGMAPSSAKMAAELPRPEYEVWALNTGYLFLGDAWDRWYEVHRYDWLLNRPGLHQQKYFEWLATDHGRPVYVPQLDERIKNAAQYPFLDVVQRFGRRLPDGKPVIYFQSTVDWMLAHAIYEYQVHTEQLGERPDWELHVLGVDMALGDEYAHQRPSCEYWLGIAQGMGITIAVPDRADIQKIRYVYGIDSYEPVAAKLGARREELEAQLQNAARAEAHARDKKMMVRGALEAQNWLEQQRY